MRLFIGPEKNFFRSIKMNIYLSGKELVFKKVALTFIDEEYNNIFADKNNKTLKETVSHNRYKKFKGIVEKKYSNFLNFNLGVFLKHLKDSNDMFYLQFLNKHGDKTYSHFFIDENDVLQSKGLYLYSINEEVKYIGRCKDSFKKRINQGYGKIHPKNCYLDGQSTNCHLNSLITQNKKHINFYIHEMTDDKKIIEFEDELIKKYLPIWNTKL